jgi:hypothetical protein
VSLEQVAGMPCEREHERVLGDRDDGNISTGPGLAPCACVVVYSIQVVITGRCG